MKDKKEVKRRKSIKSVSLSLNKHLGELQVRHSKLVEEHDANVSQLASQIEVLKGQIESIRFALSLMEEPVSCES